MGLLTFIARRGMGKTGNLILECERLNTASDGKINTLILVAEPADVRRVYEFAKRLGCTHVACGTLNDIHSWKYSRYTNVLVDDLDRVLAKVIAPARLIGYSATLDAENEITEE